MTNTMALQSCLLNGVASYMFFGQKHVVIVDLRAQKPERAHNGCAPHTLQQLQCDPRACPAAALQLPVCWNNRMACKPCSTSCTA